MSGRGGGRNTSRSSTASSSAFRVQNFEQVTHILNFGDTSSSCTAMCPLTIECVLLLQNFEQVTNILNLVFLFCYYSYRGGCGSGGGREREREREREAEIPRQAARHRRALSECKFLISNLVLFLFYYYSYRSGSGRESGRDTS